MLALQYKSQHMQSCLFGRLFPGIIKPEGKNDYVTNCFLSYLQPVGLLLIVVVVVSSIFSSRLWSRKLTPEPTTASTEHSMRPASPSSRPPANTFAMETQCESSWSSHLSDAYFLYTCSIEFKVLEAERQKTPTRGQKKRNYPSHNSYKILRIMTVFQHWLLRTLIVSLAEEKKKRKEKYSANVKWQGVDETLQFG